MAFIGNKPATNFVSFAKQTLTGDGGTGYTLTHSVANANDIDVFVNNVRQEPGVAYTVSGTALTMTGNVLSTDDFYVIFRARALQSVVHPSDSPLSATNGTFNRLASHGDIISLEKDGSRFGALGSQSSGFYIDGESGHSGLRFANGAVTPRENLADADNSNDLGASNNRWANLYLGGGLYVGGTGSSNYLQEYEIGGWTPAVHAGSISGTSISYAGEYVKIGDFIHLFMSATNTAGNIQISSYVQFSGVPFTLNNQATGVFVTEDIDIKTRQGFVAAGQDKMSLSAGGSSSGTTAIYATASGRLS